MLIGHMCGDFEEFESEIFLLCLTPVLILDNGHGPLKKSNSASGKRICRQITGHRSKC
jgi:hypothetical protein